MGSRRYRECQFLAIKDIGEEVWFILVRVVSLQGCQIGRPRGSRTSGTSSGRERPDVRSDVASAR